MSQNAATTLPHAQTVFSIPFGNKALLPAGFLNYGAIFGRKESLPADIKTVGEIANVHQAEIFEFFPDRRIKLLVNLAAINNGSATAFLRGDHAEEADSRRPGVHMRTLVVIENRLVLGIWSGGVDLAGNAFTRQVTIFSVNFVVNRSRHALKILRCREAESAEQDAAMQVKFAVYVVAIVSRPVGEIHFIGRRFYN